MFGRSLNLAQWRSANRDVWRGLVGSLAGRDFCSLTDLSAAELAELLTLAIALKKKEIQPDLRGRVLGLLFRKASTRTRVSFAAAMAQCGGTTLDLVPTMMQVSRGEPIADTARVLTRYLDVIAIRTFEQAEIETFAQYATVPVINALSDESHPCQILADLQTLQEVFGQLAGLTVAYCGDGNNVVHSLLLGCALAGVHVRVATPPGFEPAAKVVDQARAIARTSGSQVMIGHDPVAAVTGAVGLYTDVWASMGQEAEATDRLPRFQPYQLNQELLDQADSEAIVLHCLPAHRGEEITEAVLEGPQSRVWQQAENRLHAQKALLVSLLGVV